MVGHRPLEASILVRIQVPQQIKPRKGYLICCGKKANDFAFGLESKRLSHIFEDVFIRKNGKPVLLL